MTLRWISSCSENVHENARKGWFWSTYSSCSCVIMLKYFVKKELWNCQTGWKTAELGCLQMTIHSISGFDLIKNTIIANAPKCIEQQLRKLYQIFYENRTEKGQVILKPQSNCLGRSRIQGYIDAIQCPKISSIKAIVFSCSRFRVTFVWRDEGSYHNQFIWTENKTFQLLFFTRFCPLLFIWAALEFIWCHARRIYCMYRTDEQFQYVAVLRNTVTIHQLNWSWSSSSEQ